MKITGISLTDDPSTVSLLPLSESESASKSFTFARVTYGPVGKGGH